MLPIKITNRNANKYHLAKHNVTDTNKVLGLVAHLPPGVNLPQIKKCCAKVTA